MFKKITALSAIAAAMLATNAFAGASLEDRVSELEANSMLNIFSFSGSLITRYDNVQTNQNMTSTTGNNNVAAWVRTQIANNTMTSFDATTSVALWTLALKASTTASISSNAATIATAIVTTNDTTYTPLVTSSVCAGNDSGACAKKYITAGAYQTLVNNVVNQTAIKNANTDNLREKLYLNANAKVSDRISFYSTLSMTKRFNGFAKQGQTSSTQLDDIYSYNSSVDSSVRVKKAYADVRLPDGNTVFSFGRLPTTDGVPVNYWNAKARMGTYPMLSYNTVVDGFALTYNFDNLLFAKDSGNKLAARVLYTPFSNTNYGTAVNSLNSINQPTESTNTKLEPTIVDMAAVQLDYSNDRLTWAQSVGFVAQYMTSAGLHFNTGGSSNAPANVYDPTDLSLKMQLISATAELNNIAHTGLDLALSWYSSSLDSSGTYFAYDPAAGGRVASGVSGATSQFENVYIPLGGFGSSLDSTGKGVDQNLSGNVILVSAKYNLKSSTAIGAEYQTGTQSVVVFDYGGESLAGCYGTPGSCYHAYVTHNFDSNLNLRVGYYQQNYSYLPATYGTPVVATDRVVNNYYANLRLDF